MLLHSDRQSGGEQQQCAEAEQRRPTRLRWSAGGVATSLQAGVKSAG
jgi:hypothetical protein